jgi:signal peptidase I
MSKKEKETKSKIKSAKVSAPKNIVVEYFESFVVTLIMALFGMTFIIQAVTVPTGSMQNTILIGDYLLVNKFIFAPSGNPLPFLPQREIKRGDIIVFKYPGFRDDPQRDSDRGLIPYQINYVKRVIGLPGETIEFRNNQVFINGELLPEHRIIGDANDDQSALKTTEFEDKKDDQPYDVYYRSDTMKMVESGQNLPTSQLKFATKGKPMKIPEGNYFVMGDSRDNSEDSRYWGFVPRELIIGQAMFVYWSCDRAASGGSIGGCITSPRLDRIGKIIR